MVHVQSLLTLLSLSPIRMRNSWRECQGLAWSGPPRERRSSNAATASSSGRGKKTHTHTRFPPLSLFPLALFFHVPSLLLPVSSLISPIFSLLSSFIFASPCSSSSFLPSSSSFHFPSSLPSLIYYCFILFTQYWVSGLSASVHGRPKHSFAPWEAIQGQLEGWRHKVEVYLSPSQYDIVSFPGSCVWEPGNETKYGIAASVPHRES